MTSTVLTPNHFTERDASAIRPDLWQLNTRYLDGDAAIERFLADVDTAGFTDRTQTDAQWRALRKRSQIQAIEHGALFFEGIDPLTDDTLAWVRCKPVQPRRSHRDGKVVKYETPPKQPLRISFFRVTPEIWQAIADRYSVPTPTDGTTFWQWVQIHPEIELVITEGEKKALALLSAGYVAVSVPGINCGYRKNIDGTRLLHPDLLPFANRRIVIAFDQDEKSSTRLKVDCAIATTARLLTEAGAVARVARWDGSTGKGIDDYIAAGGNLDHIIEQASSPPKLDLYFARKRAANRLGKYRPDLKVCVPCLSAIAPESIPSTGIVAIIGNTGTGKTKLLKAIAEGLDGVIAPNPRIAVGRGLSETIGLTYLQDADRGNGYLMDANGKPTRRIGLCWDSLLGIPIWLYPDGSFDLILDEADQGFSHLISGGTCGKDGKRPALIARAIELILGARRIILASATLTYYELDLVCALRNETPWILENTYQANSYPITLYSGKQNEKGSSTRARSMAIAALTDELRAGQRVIVPTDQILTAKVIAAIGISCGLEEAQILRFDRELSSEDLQREFADHPDNFLARHDIKLLVHSPSLTSGVSIEGDFFDLVIGLFEGQSISPDDAFQALARVRRPIPRIVYASHYGKSNSTFDATRTPEFAAQYARRAALVAHVSGSKAITTDDPISAYHTATQAARNATMQSFGVSLQAQLEAAGCKVTVRKADEVNEAIELWRTARAEAIEADYWAKRCAAIVTPERASELRKSKRLKYSEALELQRFELCDFYQIDPENLEIEDIARDRHGHYRREILRLEGLLWDGLNHAKDFTKMEQLISHNAPIQVHDLPGRELFGKTAIAIGIPELLQHVIESDGWRGDTVWVQEFTAKVRKLADDLKLACGFRIHAKMTDCQIIGMVLKHFGLRTTSRQFGRGKNRYRVYHLDMETLDRLKGILRRRAEIHIERGFSPNTDLLFKSLLDGVCTTQPMSSSHPLESRQNLTPPSPSIE